MRTPQNRAARGFTLIELVVGLSVSLLVMSAVMDAVVEIRKQAIRSVASGDLNRNSRMVITMMSRYLKMAGSGMPAPDATSVDNQAYNGGANVPFNGGTLGPHVIVGAASTIGLVGDFARPDSNFTGVSTPAHAEGYQRNSCQQGAQPGGSRFVDDNNDFTNHTTIVNELSGGCLAGAGCDTTQSSLVFPNQGSSCTATAGGLTQVTCPWALNKYRPEEYFLLVYPNNTTWINRRIDQGSFTDLSFQGAGVPIHQHPPCQGMSFFYDAWGGSNISGHAENMPAINTGWSTAGQVHTSLVYPVNRGWISTPERVFFTYDSGLHRLQYLMCWGPLARLDDKWPNSTHLNTAIDGTNCTLGSYPAGGTGMQTFARNVQAFTLTYYDLANTAMAAPLTYAQLSTVTRVGVYLKLEKTVGGNKVVSEQKTSVQLRSRRFR